MRIDQRSYFSSKVPFDWLNVSQSLFSNPQDFVNWVPNLLSLSLLDNQWILSSRVVGLFVDKIRGLQSQT